MLLTYFARLLDCRNTAFTRKFHVIEKFDPGKTLGPPDVALSFFSRPWSYVTKTHCGIYLAYEERGVIGQLSDYYEWTMRDVT
jgi:hypothetical protein